MSRPRHRVPLLVLPVLLLGLAACDADVWIESPGERREAAADTVERVPVVVDTVYRPEPIDSVAASFAWLAARPTGRITTGRSFPAGAEEAARQFVRALGQTGSSTRGTIGAGDVGYQRAFTYVHPRVRGPRTSDQWQRSLAGVVKVALVRLEPVPGDSTLVFAELLVLRELDRQSMIGLYHGHFAAAPGDNGWQLTAARFVSEDWQSPLGGIESWRYDRARAGSRYAELDPDYGLDLVRLHSGEWVPLAMPVPVADLRFGLPDLL